MTIHRFRPSLLPLAGLLTLVPVACGAAAKDLPTGVVGPPPTTQQEQSTLLEMQDAFTKIAESVEPTVVNIKAERPGPTVDPDQGGIPLPLTPRPSPRGRRAPSDPNGAPPAARRQQATGSGVIVRTDGYILTNDHVVEGAQDGLVTVTLSDGREFKGRVFPDFRSDLAVVKIDPGTSPLPAARFADSDLVKPGQWAIAVGSPFDLQNTMTVGVISATGRHQSIPGDAPGEGRYYPDLIQTDAAINPGNSGGPLFNINGQVVGINVAIESPVEGSAGIGFAIPSAIAQQIMATLISQGKVVRGQLGVVPKDLTPALQLSSGQKQGAFLSDISLDSPASKAGLEAADIVTSFDGKPVTGEVSLREAISSTPPGKRVAIGYVRDGQPGTALATLGTAPADTANTPPATKVPAVARPKLGLLVRDLAARDRQQLSLPPTTSGVLVTGVVPNSPAEDAGLGLPGASGSLVIQRVGRMAVTSKAQFDQAIAALPPDSLVTFVAIGLDPQSNTLHQSAFSIQL